MISNWGTKSIAVSASLSIMTLVFVVGLTKYGMLNAGFENAEIKDGKQSKMWNEYGIKPTDIAFLYLEWIEWFLNKTYYAPSVTDIWKEE